MKKKLHGTLIIAVLLGIAELTLYLLYGRTSFDPNYSTWAIVGMGAGIGLGLIALISRLRLFAFGSYLGFLYGLIHVIVSQINLIANILYGVDGSTFPPTFFLMMISAVLSCLLALAAAIAWNRVSKKGGQAQ